MLKPQPEGHYIAESTFFPLAVFRFALEPTTTPHPGLQTTLGHNPGGLWSSWSCAGAIRGLEHVVFKAFSLPLVA